MVGALLSRFRYAWLAGLGLACASNLSFAQAADYPTKPVKFVVGYASGGPTDIIARLIAQEMVAQWGQAVVVENRSGANGNIATESVAQSANDGYTVLVNTLSHNVNALVHTGSVRYHPEKDFAPVCLAVVLPQLLIVAYDSPYKTLGDLLKYGRSKSAGLSYGSAGHGSSAHLAGALLAERTKVKAVHVPFRGNAPALLEVVAGRVDFMFYPMVGLAEQVANKRVRILASTTPKRHVDFPDIPTMGEAGFADFEDYVGPVGFMLPANVPSQVLNKLARHIQTVLGKPSVRDKLKNLGAITMALGPGEYREWLQQDRQRWAQLIKAANIKAED